MSHGATIKAIEKHKLIVGPLFRPGIKNDLIGWSIYANWTQAGDDIFDMPGHLRALANHKSLTVAVREAVKKIRVSKRPAQATSKETKSD